MFKTLFFDFSRKAGGYEGFKEFFIADLRFYLSMYSLFKI